MQSQIERAAVVAEARMWIGTPYQHQASLKGVGCDCLGLVRGIWRAIHGEEPEPAPPYAPDWAEASAGDPFMEAAMRHLVSIGPADLRPGDVLLFRWRPALPAKHAAVASATHTIVHAQEGAVVAEVPFAPWWRRRLAGVFRFPGVID